MNVNAQRNVQDLLLNLKENQLPRVPFVIAGRQQITEEMTCE
jgi:hypothetical protein